MVHNTLLAAVPAQLLLPYRQTLLHFLDHVAARRKGFVAMRRGGSDRDARLAGGNDAEPVLEHDARLRPLCLRVAQNTFDLGDRHRLVGGVVDAGDVPVVPHGAEKHAGAPALGALDCGEQVVDIERVTREMNHHPPDSGGSSATSSPSVTDASS